MNLRIIGAGYGRTGTQSLREALRILGYDPPYHMADVYDNDDTDAWHRKATGGEIDWDEILGGYDVAIDWPSSSYYEELAELNPDAKVILTTRDPDAWYNSVMSILYAFYKAVPRWRRLISPSLRKRVESMEKLIWNGVFDGRVEDAEYAKRLFTDHNEKVERTVSPDRLLVFGVKEGWQPLCDFLGVPVPDMPFPHVGKTRALKRKIRKLRIQWYIPHAIAATAVIAYFLV